MVKKISAADHRLSDADVKLIAHAVKTMPVQLRPTWPKIIDLAKAITNQTYTRQALSAHADIAEAYGVASKNHQKIKGGGILPSPKPDADSLKDQKIAKLEGEVDRQRELIDALQDLLVRFVGNAALQGITQEQMEAALPDRSRQRTDIDAMAEKTKEARKRQRRG